MRLLVALSILVVMSVGAKADPPDQQVASAQVFVGCSAVLTNGTCAGGGHPLTAQASVFPSAGFNVALTGTFLENANTCNMQPWTLQQLIDACTPMVNASFWKGCSVQGPTTANTDNFDVGPGNARSVNISFIATCSASSSVLSAMVASAIQAQATGIKPLQVPR